MEARISGTTKLFGLIGSPVSHSASPAMQNYGFQACGVDGAYLAFDIKEEEVPEFVKSMRLLNIQGCNVTMPNKTAAAQNMDELSPAAELIGAVNTIVNRDGKLYGHITDGEGFVANLKDHGIGVEGKDIVIFGAGGAATAIQVQCALDGAKSITIFNPRDPFFERAQKMVEKIKAKVPECQVELYDLDAKDTMREKIDAADILVNGTWNETKRRYNSDHRYNNVPRRISCSRCCIQSRRNKILKRSKRTWMYHSSRKRNAIMAGSCIFQIIYRERYAG